MAEASPPRPAPADAVKDGSPSPVAAGESAPAALSFATLGRKRPAGQMADLLPPSQAGSASASLTVPLTDPALETTRTMLDTAGAAATALERHYHPGMPVRAACRDLAQTSPCAPHGLTAAAAAVAVAVCRIRA